MTTTLVTFTGLVREAHVLPLAMFFGTFAWSFVYVSLPFHIQRISTWDATATLRWTGWILGISPLATVVTAPLWGRLAGRGNPKRYYAASTFAFISAGRAQDPGQVRRQVAERRLVAVLLVGFSVAVGALAVAPGVWSYGALRFLQVLCIAPVFPIVVSRIAHSAGGEAVGVINAARIGASFVGPVVATSLLAAGSPVLLYTGLALAGLACLPLSALRSHVPAVAR